MKGREMKHRMNERKSIFASTDVSTVLNNLTPGLKIDENDLDTECQQQATLFHQVSDELTFALSRRDEAKTMLTEIEAAVDLELRRKAREKPTDRAIAAMVRVDPRVMEAVRNQLKLAHEASRLSTLKESYQQRSYMLKEMPKLYLASYFGDISATGDSSQVKTVRASVVKSELNRMRRGE